VGADLALRFEARCCPVKHGVAREQEKANTFRPSSYSAANGAQGAKQDSRSSYEQRRLTAERPDAGRTASGKRCPKASRSGHAVRDRHR